MSGVIQTGSFVTDLLPVVDKVFGNSYKDWDPLYSRIFDVSSTKERYVTDYKINGLGLPVVKPEGQSILYDSMAGEWAYRYEHTVYIVAYSISREAMDDLHAVKAAAEGAKAAKRAQLQGREVICTNVLNNGFSGGPTYGDGQVLYSASHPTVGGGNVSNLLTSAAQFGEAAAEAARIQIRGWVDGRGLKTNFMPKTLVISPATEFDAIRATKNVDRPSTADRDISAINYLGLYQDVVVSPYLSSTTAWFVTTDCPNGLKYIERDALEVGVDDSNFDTETARFKSRIRYAVGNTDPLGSFGTPGA